jgi:hypothetical protein
LIFEAFLAFIIHSRQLFMVLELLEGFWGWAQHFKVLLLILKDVNFL